MEKYDRFTVLEGGKESRPKKRGEDQRVFTDAYVTNTRFMGVLGVHAHWIVPGGGRKRMENEHHFFYIDCEDGCIENFSAIGDEDSGEAAYVEAALINGLGGEKVPLDQREVSILIKHYWDQNVKNKLPLPTKEEALSLYFKAAEGADEAEIEAVLGKQYAGIRNTAEAINYFIMRYFVRDGEALKALCAEGFEPGLYRGELGTVAKNNIERIGKTAEYNCETLLDCEKAYYHIVSRVHMGRGKKISAMSITSRMKISSEEAAMILARPEFVTVYELASDPENHEDAFLKLSNGNEGVAHDTGYLFVRFFPHNRHVGSMKFALSDDVAGVCYVTDYGQLILGSYSHEGIAAMERQLLDTSLGLFAYPVKRYEFREPMLYDFIQSGFSSFEEYLAAVRRD